MFNEFESKGITDICKHELALFIIEHRPRGWKSQIQQYIANISHNSFYLMDISQKLRMEYKYTYASQQTLGELEHLLKVAHTKHLTGNKNPGSKLLSKMTFKDGFVPKRDIPD